MLERRLTLLEACWSEFDDIASRVSAELRRGPRGGGRDRDQTAYHELDHAWEMEDKDRTV